MTINSARFTALLFLLLVIFVSASAFADCAAPSTPGLRICFPSQDSKVTYAAGIEMGATAKSGSIVKSAVYDNGKLVDSFDFLPGTLYDYGMINGLHNIVVKAWDSAGNAYQASRSFRVVGFGVGFCSTPSEPGINFCWPKSDSSQPNSSVSISATARGGGSKIRSLSVYVDGIFRVGSSNNYILTSVGVAAGSHRVAIVAKDYAGHTFKSVHNIKTFYDYTCNPKTGACSPGIVIHNPTGPDVSSSFRLDAQVVNNPKPTTSMKVYLDSKVIATSTGPGITAQINLPKGTTHIVAVKAWDTEGKTYAAFQNLYVQ
ncbi:MAG TPA: hypothetical protein VN622_11905 [Clostridia bacterium]|nr:hypothetical protein [Clostridia bacterium]